MPAYHSIREVPHPADPAVNKGPNDWNEGDVLVLFGELFQRGYANGLVEAAEKRFMSVVRSTVGRREKDGSLRALNDEERALQPKAFINVPLEAGFDMEPVQDELSLVELIKDVKLNDWSSFKLDASLVATARAQGRERFRKQVRTYLRELEAWLPADRGVHFAHLMAGGVPRARILMPIMNRVFKGTGDRFLESEVFWKSDLGHFCSESFSAVTADTFEVLLEETADLRKRKTAKGMHVSYSGYGYHGTEILFGDEYKWQSYAPYLQGWAKMELENVAKKYHGEGVKAAIYNCPEILTNSSSIFQGVEVPLYPLLNAIKKESTGSAKCDKIWAECAALLQPGVKVEDILNICEKTLTDPRVKARSNFETWPDHNEQQQMETLLAASNEIIGKHVSDKNLMTSVLSEVVFEACGDTMLADMRAPQSPVSWINHDLVAKHFAHEV